MKIIMINIIIIIASMAKGLFQAEKSYKRDLGKTFLSFS